MIECLDYFWWDWEPYSINEVTAATKYDKEKINVYLWDLDGKGEHIENSCELLIHLFFVGGLETSLHNISIGYTHTVKR